MPSFSHYKRGPEFGGCYVISNFVTDLHFTGIHFSLSTMGACFSGANYTDPTIDARLRRDKKDDMKCKKLLLVGSPHSGKTTIWKQLQNIHGDSIDSKEDKKFKPKDDIRQNCIDDILTLCEINGDQKSIELLEELSIGNESDLPQIANVISNAWNKYKITYIHRFNHGQDGYIFNDNMQPIFDRIEEIMSDEYVPTMQDITNSKSHYSASIECTFTIKGTSFGLIDAPYRITKDINHCFEHIAAVIFVASLADYAIYDDYLRENQMHIALNYFEEICNIRWFIQTPMIVLLNKKDLFIKCIEDGLSLRYCFEDLPSDFPEYSNPKLPLVVPWIARNSIKEESVPMDIIELI